MPPPDPKMAHKMPAEEPPKAHGPQDTPKIKVPPDAVKGDDKDKPMETVKDDEGKPVIMPVTQATAGIPHEGDEEVESEEDLDRTVPGGKYQVGDKLVNSEGEVLEDAPKAKKK